MWPCLQAQVCSIHMRPVERSGRWLVGCWCSVSAVRICIVPSGCLTNCFGDHHMSTARADTADIGLGLHLGLDLHLHTMSSETRPARHHCWISESVRGLITAKRAFFTGVIQTTLTTSSFPVMRTAAVCTATVSTCARESVGSSLAPHATNQYRRSCPVATPRGSSATLHRQRTRSCASTRWKSPCLCVDTL